MKPNEIVTKEYLQTIYPKRPKYFWIKSLVLNIVIGGLYGIASNVLLFLLFNGIALVIGDPMSSLFDPDVNKSLFSIFIFSTFFGAAIVLIMNYNCFLNPRWLNRLIGVDEYVKQRETFNREHSIYLQQQVLKDVIAARDKHNDNK